jgi:hypothetical protein
MGKLFNYCAGLDPYNAPSSRVESVLTNVVACNTTKTAVGRMIKQFKTLKVENRMMDSSGYQIYLNETKKPEIVYIEGQPQATLERRQLTYDPLSPAITKRYLNITHAHIVECAIRIEANVLQALDYPLHHTKHPGEQEYQFLRALGFNTHCARETGLLREKECPDKCFMVPAQVFNLRHLNVFMEYLGTKVIIDGLSLPIRNHGINEVCLFLAKFYQLGFRVVHVFGTSKFWVIAVLAYFARNHFDITSFDAQTWSMAAMKEQYYQPYILRPITMKISNPLLDKIKLTCECPWCSYYTTLREIADLDYTEKTDFLRRHNWFVFEQARNQFFANAASPITLRNYLIEKASGREKEIAEIYRCLVLVDININQRIEVLEAMLTSDLVIGG